MVEDKIMTFMPDEYRWHKVRIDEVTKPGDIRLHGMSFMKGKNGAAPILYLDPYYEMYKEGLPEDRILREIAEKYVEIERNVPGIELPDMSYEKIKDKLRVRLLYNRTNGESLKSLVNLDAGCGYSLAAFIDLSSDVFDGAVINIHRDMLGHFDYDEEEILKTALEGSVRHCPARLSHMEDVLMANPIGMEPVDLLAADRTSHVYDGVLVLTTPDNYAGAAALFYPEVKERIAELIRGNYFVLPSSIHEMLILPDTGDRDPGELAAMVMAVNASEVMPQERLGNRVLYYDADSGRLDVACDLDIEKSMER